MIRFIIKNERLDPCNGLKTENYITVDAVCDELESVIKTGGFGENGYDFNMLIGVELITKTETNGKGNE